MGQHRATRHKGPRTTLLARHIATMMCAIAALILTAHEPAQANEATTKALQQGIAAANSGKPDTAIAHLTAVIKADERSAADLAKALHYRAKAYYNLDRPSLAIADLDTALWLKKLAPLARDDAIQLREKAQLKAQTTIPTRQLAIAPTPLRRPKTAKSKPPTTTASIKPVTQPLMPWQTTARTTTRNANPVATAIAPLAPFKTKVTPTATATNHAPQPKPTIQDLKPAIASKAQTASKPADAPWVTTARSAPRTTVRKPPAIAAAKTSTLAARQPAPVPNTWPAAKTTASITKPKVTAFKPAPPAAPPAIPGFSTKVVATKTSPRTPAARNTVAVATPLAAAAKPVQTAKRVTARTAAITTPTTTALAPAPTPPISTAQVPATPISPTPATVTTATTQDAPANKPTTPSATSKIIAAVPVVESFLELSGLKEKPSPTSSLLAAAEDLAKRRRERIKRHNETFAAAEREAAPAQ